MNYKSKKDCPTVFPGDWPSFEKALRILGERVAQGHTFATLKTRRLFPAPGERRQEKKRLAERRLIKAINKQQKGA